MNGLHSMKQYHAATELYTLKGDFVTREARTDLAEITDNGFLFTCDDYILKTELEKHPSGVTLRRDTVQNTSGRPLSIRAALSKFVFNGGEYDVYTQYSEWCGESRGRWQLLNTRISAESEEVRCNCGAAPFVALYNKQNDRGIAFHILADSLWQYDVTGYFTFDGMRRTVRLELGIREQNFDYVLQPGETLAFAPILFYEFRNRNDMDAYKLHRYCNDAYPARSFPVVYNSWMSHSDRIPYERITKQLQNAKKLGAEYFVVDAGWFGAPGQWHSSVGDWEESPDSDLKGQLGKFADDVRAAGLQFGLWFEIERAALTTNAVKNHPDYYLYEGGHAFVNFGKPEAVDYIFGVLSGQIKKYGIRFIKFDFNARLTCDPSSESFLAYFAGYREFLHRIRVQHPEVYIENCASGGLRMALSSMRDMDSFWISDNHSLYTQLDIFKNTMIRMPCRALEKWLSVQSIVHEGAENVEKILSSGDCGWGHVEAVNFDYIRTAMVGGPMGISCNLETVSEDLMEKLAAMIAEYKQEREFWMRAECRILADTDTMLALQFSDAEANEVKLYAYAKEIRQNSLTLYPVTDGVSDYETADGTVYSAETLLEEGVELYITTRYTAVSTSLKKKA